LRQFGRGEWKEVERIGILMRERNPFGMHIFPYQYEQPDIGCMEI
jgi:hypothetical protein